MTSLRPHLHILHDADRTAGAAQRARRVILAALTDPSAPLPDPPHPRAEPHWPYFLDSAPAGNAALQSRLRIAVLSLARVRLLTDATAVERQRWRTRAEEVTAEVFVLLHHMPALRRTVPGLLRTLAQRAPAVMWTQARAREQAPSVKRRQSRLRRV